MFSECSLVENRIILNVLYKSTAAERTILHRSTVSTYGLYIAQKWTILLYTYIYIHIYIHTNKIPLTNTEWWGATTMSCNSGPLTLTVIHVSSAVSFGKYGHCHQLLTTIYHIQTHSLAFRKYKSTTLRILSSWDLTWCVSIRSSFTLNIYTTPALDMVPFFV